MLVCVAGIVVVPDLERAKVEAVDSVIVLCGVQRLVLRARLLLLLEVALRADARDFLEGGEVDRRAVGGRGGVRGCGCGYGVLGVEARNKLIAQKKKTTNTDKNKQSNKK